MATAGQEGLIRKLMGSKTIPNQFVGMDITPLSTSEASELIKILLSQPNKYRTDGAAKNKKDYVPEGFYYYEGAVYQVVSSKFGNRYAKILVNSGGRGTWGYSPEVTPLLELTHLLSLSEAKQLGKDYGFCIVCGRTLTDPESIANGIGPICAGRF